MFASEPVKAACLAEGFDLVGVCSAEAPVSHGVLKDWVERGMHGEMGYMSESLGLRSDLNSVLAGVKSVVMVGLNYYQVVGEGLPPLAPPSFSPSAKTREGEPKIARYALGRDYHKVIRGKLRRVGETMRGEWGGEWRAATDSAPIMERELANRAGLGWFGKNTMLIDSKRGSWFLIGSLLTTVEIEPDSPAVGGCGTCTACIEACPTGAIVHSGERWEVDARRCISYLTIEKRGSFSDEEEGMVGDWTFGCDVCQEVCPFNQPRESQPLRSAVTGEKDFLARRSWPGLEELAVISEEEWEERSRGSAVRRAGAEGIRRNARANLGNESG